MDTNFNCSGPDEGFSTGHPDTVRIEALGDLELRSGGEALHYGGARLCKPLELLLGLIAAGPRGLGQHVLCEALWPASEGDASYRALITTVFRLRRLLGNRELVRFQGGKVALDARHCQVDAWEFEQALKSQIDSHSTRSALELYRGPLLGETESPLVFEARDRLRRKFVRAVLHAAQQLESTDQLDDAQRLLEHSIEADGACEDLHRALIVLLGRHGETQAAMDAWQCCRMALRRRSGTLPSAATERAWREACNPQATSHSAQVEIILCPAAM